MASTLTRTYLARTQLSRRCLNSSNVNCIRQLSRTRAAVTNTVLRAVSENNNALHSTRRLSGPQQQSSRFFSSKPEPQYTISDLSDDDYHTVSDAAMDRMVEYFEDIGDEHEIPGYDVEYQSGVMTLKLGDKGTYVVNKQPPNKQLWLSSPTSGPKRYDYDQEHETWFYNRDHHSLKYLLDTEITKALGFDINVPVDKDL
ncbi:Mitochondrial chaperone Frataxin [Podila minutissima]|nr:Mitochondrial chaperone Frataxin [Podila minutissima]